jgi:serine/threonine protein kinase
VTVGDATLVTIAGHVDEHFAGFGAIGGTKIVILDVSGMMRMTSFGVRQWLKAMNSLPKTVTDLYLLGCPTFFVDQLNMVLNFGGPGKVLTVVAPHTCPACGVESGEIVDVLTDRASLAKGALPDKECARCGGRLEFDETPESYFAFMGKYAASSLQPAAAQLLAQRGLYTSAEGSAEKPPKIIKLVHGSVTYFRIIGAIGTMFRARPLLVGAEGEVVIDLAEVERFDPAGHKEWRRLVKTLTAQVPAVTLVDVTASFLAEVGDTVSSARNIAVSSVRVPYRCVECQRPADESVPLGGKWPMQLAARVCSTCGGMTKSELPAEALAPLQKAGTAPPIASAKLIAQRAELMSRAVIDAHVAQAGESATAAVAADDTILGKYKIVRRLSAGGMAEVFLAKQVGIGGFEKPVALKRIQRKLLEQRHMAIELFLNEAKIAGRLTHPNIVQVLDVGEVQGALYLAMEYVHGRDLRNVIKRLQQQRTVLPLGEACHVVREVATALHHAYWSTDMTGKQLAVVHRDVSPHNIILSYDGTVKLLDFGVAMSAVTEHAETMIVGKWLYMSPESTLQETVDHRSDLFSLGVILYLLCSGYMPFSGADPKEIVKKIRAGQYTPLHQLASVPERLAQLVDRMLAPNPDHRPQRGQEVAAELAEIARHHGFESSGASLAVALRQLFPDAGGVVEGDRPVRETGRMNAEGDVGSFTMKERSPVSVTPTTGSMGTGRALAPVDLSETYRPRSALMAAVLPPDTSPPPLRSTAPRLATPVAGAPVAGRPRTGPTTGAPMNVPMAPRAGSPTGSPVAAPRAGSPTGSPMTAPRASTPTGSPAAPAGARPPPSPTSPGVGLARPMPNPTSPGVGPAAVTPQPQPAPGLGPTAVTPPRPSPGLGPMGTSPAGPPMRPTPMPGTPMAPGGLPTPLPGTLPTPLPGTLPTPLPGTLPTPLPGARPTPWPSTIQHVTPGPQPGMPYAPMLPEAPRSRGARIAVIVLVALVLLGGAAVAVYFLGMR